MCSSEEPFIILIEEAFTRKMIINLNIVQSNTHTTQDDNENYGINLNHLYLSEPLESINLGVSIGLSNALQPLSVY